MITQLFLDAFKDRQRIVSKETPVQAVDFGIETAWVSLPDGIEL